jgi:DNA repair exonuclease SbcCD nuclease subunit
MTLTNILFIGDPHFQINNITDVELFIIEITKLATSKKPDVIVIAGDLLHTHERLHTTVLNKAHEFVDAMRKIAITYILVGNHDYISNTQFLSTNHWMNAMKEWNNVVIVDKVFNVNINDENFTFVPYVYPGRFMEALNTLGDDRWKRSDCIFAHQEFEGCKMGAIISIDGDKWAPSNPLVVSGHIHSKQRPHPNVYYTGTPMQIAFGESEDNVVALLEFSHGIPYKLEEIQLDLPGKKILYMDVTKLTEYNVDDSSVDKVRITLSGDYDQFKAIKKTVKYKQLVDSGVKIVFKVDKGCSLPDDELKQDISTTDFTDILFKMVSCKKDPYLLQVYDLVVNKKQTDIHDVFFL